MRWIKDKKKIQDSKKGSKHADHDRRAKSPDVKERLYREYRDLRRKGLSVRGWWFRTKAKQLFEELHPDLTFHFSKCWFTGFKTRSHIILWRGTNKCQRQPADKKAVIQVFHCTIRNEAKSEDLVGPLGKFELKRIANVDQTPLPFTFTDGTTYEDTGRSIKHLGMWRSIRFRQETVYSAAHHFFRWRTQSEATDYLPGEREANCIPWEISLCSEISRCFSRKCMVWRAHNGHVGSAAVETSMQWQHASHSWCSQSPKKTDAILDLLDRSNTTPVYIPPGTTSLIQPLDVTFNKSYKSEVEKLANEHMQQNLEAYVRGDINASEWRVVFTKVGWGGMGKAVCKKGDDYSFLQEMWHCCCHRCVRGFWNPIEGIDDYVIEDKEDKESTDEDPFADIENEDPFGETENEDMPSDMDK